jgi:hypothetical protein
MPAHLPYAPENDLLIFTHIPKTAGTTLNNILRSHFHPTEVAQIFTHSDGSTFMEKLSPSVRLVTGHYPYGLHRFTARRCRYFTFLRQPAERVVSLYWYLRHAEDHASHSRIFSGEETFGDCVRSQYNIQTLFLAGESTASPGETLARARRHLRAEYTVVGLTERFDESLLLMQSAFQWKPKLCRRQNVTRDRPSPLHAPLEVLAALAECNRDDEVLYTDAEQILNESVARQGPDFHRHLRRRCAGMQAIEHLVGLMALARQVPKLSRGLSARQ